jgi:DNA-binding sugar fermentation-stimulating protein
VLYEYPEGRDFTTEVCRFDVKTMKATIVFREKNRAVVDVLTQPDGEVFLAAVEPPGPMPQVPVPGKLKILRSRSLETWTEMEVNYRAIAKNAFLAASGPSHVWVATDTGMILEMVP